MIAFFVPSRVSSRLDLTVHPRYPHLHCRILRDAASAVARGIDHSTRVDLLGSRAVHVMSLTLSAEATLRPLLHAARWPHANVLGLLVAAADGSEATEIVDALPLLHHWTALSPMAEAGLELARCHVAAQSPPRRIVGVYTCNARVDDLGLGRAPLAIARAIAKSLKSPAIAVVVRVARPVYWADLRADRCDTAGQGRTAVHGASLGCALLNLQAFTVDEASTSSAPDLRPVTLASPSLPQLALDLIHAGAHKSVEDFDDHLEDVGAPWLDVPVPMSVEAIA